MIEGVDHADGVENVPISQIFHKFCVSVTVRIYCIIHGRRYWNFHEMNRIFHKKMDSPWRGIQCTAMFQKVTWGLSHVLMSTKSPLQWPKPTGSGRQVSEGSINFFIKKSESNAIPARQCGERASPKLMTLLAATKTVQHRCLLSGLDMNLVLVLACSVCDAERLVR